MKEFEEFLLKLFTQMSNNNFVVNVECANNQLFKADVIGYDKESMYIKVYFHSDDLTKPVSVAVPTSGWGMETEETFDYEIRNVPVKVESIFWENIKLVK